MEGQLVLGREPGESGLRMNDAAVSRRHARIRWHDKHGLAELEDLKSKNGTFVNGLLTQRRYLESGDIIRVGDTMLAVREEISGKGAEERRRGRPSPGGTLVAQYGLAVADRQPDPEPPDLPEIVGTSPAIRELKHSLALAARGDLPILLLGDTGTGKELAAQAIHKLSGRTGPFEPVNCSAIPENLFESMFFGHRKGAFTGAAEEAAGLLARCDGGTLFLDEVGDLPLSAQPKLLRFFEDGLVRPIGSVQQKRVDVRIVAATNAPVRRMEAEGQFRSDLMSRLEGVTVMLPPLRKRREDILLLVRHFAAQAGYPSLLIDPEAAEALLIAPWPRNVREVKLLIAQKAQMVWPRRTAPGGVAVLVPRDLPETLMQTVEDRRPAPIPPKLEQQTRPSREELEEALEASAWNISTVALIYGRDRKQIYRWMEKMEIEVRGGETDSNENSGS
jgi:transcriptional regulator with GAF, ATPase, and Fis domain